MAWTKITRAQYRRDGLRYASDVSDEEWLRLRVFFRVRGGWGGRDAPVYEAS